jgi:hypothetical protein
MRHLETHENAEYSRNKAEQVLRFLIRRQFLPRNSFSRQNFPGGAEERKCGNECAGNQTMAFAARDSANMSGTFSGPLKTRFSG